MTLFNHWTIPPLSAFQRMKRRRATSNSSMNFIFRNCNIHHQKHWETVESTSTTSLILSSVTIDIVAALDVATLAVIFGVHPPTHTSKDTLFRSFGFQGGVGCSCLGQYMVPHIAPS
ncbi:hypothetical protein Ac2012v2_004476 [Leucoagaricus gongylophorus]